MCAKTALFCEKQHIIPNYDVKMYEHKADGKSVYLSGRQLDKKGIDPISDGWTFNEVQTQSMFDYILWQFGSMMRQRFGSFQGVFDEATRNMFFGKIVTLENELFYIAVSIDNWNICIELIQKNAPENESFEGLQESHFSAYDEAISECLAECVINDND